MEQIFENLEFQARARKYLPKEYIAFLIKEPGEKYWDAVVRVKIEQLIMAFGEIGLAKVVRDGFPIDALEKEMYDRLKPKLEISLKHDKPMFFKEEDANAQT